jgi:hypothetical protein
VVGQSATCTHDDQRRLLRLPGHHRGRGRHPEHAVERLCRSQAHERQSFSQARPCMSRIRAHARRSARAAGSRSREPASAAAEPSIPTRIGPSGTGLAFVTTTLPKARAVNCTASASRGMHVESFRSPSPMIVSAACRDRRNRPVSGWPSKSSVVMSRVGVTRAAATAAYRSMLLAALGPPVASCSQVNACARCRGTARFCASRAAVSTAGRLAGEPLTPATMRLVAEVFMCSPSAAAAGRVADTWVFPGSNLGRPGRGGGGLIAAGVTRGQVPTGGRRRHS